ncbi:MAG: hypothetical protein IS632_00325 [Thaumarchaeota archaeon]|nr:hypothetical protein [Nitrososphaerota archaeon]
MTDEEEPTGFIADWQGKAARFQEDTGSPEMYDRERENNIRYWLRPADTDLGLAGMVARLHEARKSKNRAARRGDGPERCKSLALYADMLLARLRAVHKYEGSLRLLWDWRAVGYDMERLIGDNVRPAAVEMCNRTGSSHSV